MSLLTDLNGQLASVTRQPVPYFTLNGVALPGLIEAEVTNASHFASDHYRAVLSSTALPAAFGPSYWSQALGDQVGIAVGFKGDNFGTAPTPLILGQVDDIEYDLAGRRIILSGRDLSAPLIDTRTAEKFVNQTSSDIAKTLAARHGLQAVVTATSQKAGTYYSNEHVVLTQEQSEWDLLIYLAEHEGFDVWVSGNTLYFQPSPVTTNPAYKIVWQEAGGSMPNSSAIDIRCSRSETLAKDVIIIVQSYNQKQQKTLKVTYKVTQANKGQRSGGKAQTYSFNVPNLSRDQAFALAKAKAEDITRHERIITATLPGDNKLTTRAMVQLVGTGTAWDQFYYPDTVTRHISFEEGYRMELRAKNHSTQSTVVIG